MATKSERQIKDAMEAANEAESVRQDLRWNVKPGTIHREEIIDQTLEMLRLAMIPIRSMAGKIVQGTLDGQATEADVQQASLRLQYERKQLKKMQR